uniref:Uncharacterized protein n=1 Tax=Thermobia domestica TaxID=89055 RepID=A4FSG6_THEDO|nr:hypothetical protein [Thermobia domestica]
MCLLQKDSHFFIILWTPLYCGNGCSCRCDLFYFLRAVFLSGKAPVHSPGYWIKRPSAELSRTGSNPKRGGSSFIDYRTERYRITDLFPDAPPDEKTLREDPKIAKE